ncbi:hypothetical protein CRUP_006073 [Coryphaenoides rupestris]|nr:hypothetical protein CRUP_006073 [Coryphaenoides rupestris]
MDCLPKEVPEIRGLGLPLGASSSGGPNLVAHPRAKSKVWRYFGFDTDADGCILHWKRIYCRVCMSQIAYSGNTSNLSYHLEKNHPAEFGDLVKSNTGHLREMFASAVARSKPEPLVQYLHPHPQQAPDLSHRPQGFGGESRRRSDLTQAVCNFICEGMYPVSVVEEPTFRALLRAADPRYTLPSKYDLAIKMLPQMYGRARDAVLAELASVVNCGVTTDLWHSHAQSRVYISLSVHAVHHSAAAGFSVGSKCLKTFEVQDDDTAENITRAMYEAFVEWGVIHKVSGVTTNSSPDIVKACSLLELSVQMPCLGHTVGRGVEEAFGLPRVEAFLAACRRLVDHFQDMSVSLYVLREKRRQHGMAERPLVRDRGRSWPATLAMLQRLREQRPAIAAALAESPGGLQRSLSFEAADWARVEAWIEVLQPFKVVTELMAACRYPTISMVRPVLHMLLSTTLKAKDTDPKEIGTAKEVVSKALSAAYAQTHEVAAFLNVATFLDPRYKRLPFLSAQERSQVESHVVEEAKAVLEKLNAEQGPPCPGDFSPLPSEDEPACKKASLLPEHQAPGVGPSQDNPLAAIFCQSDVDQSQEELHAQVVEELGNYKSQRLLGLNEDPLLWWSSHAALFPTLPKVLQKYWCVPATAVPCHRLFGPSGPAHSGKRSRLAPPALVDPQKSSEIWR